MDFKIITSQNKRYPACLKKYFSGYNLPQLTVAGNLEILVNRKTPRTALFCSRDCPGSLILSAFDHVSALRDDERFFVSGFHSEMERECLNILLRGSQSIIICPARAIQNMRIPGEWEKSLAENRLLIVSLFDKSHKRVTAKLANQRNNFVAALSDEIFVIHAKSGARTFSLAVEAIKAGKKTYTINDTENKDLIRAGAVPVE